MNASEAFQRSTEYNEPVEAEIKGYLLNIEYGIKTGKFIYWHNTTPCNIEASKELIKRHGYRIFIRKGNDCNGYPLWCIYWGNEINPVENFNVGSDKNLIYELTI
jgi:hypothetical protein